MERIRTERQAHGMTCEQLGERLGVSGSAVSKWERTDANLRAHYILEMSNLFGCSCDYLLGESDERIRLTR